MLKASFNLVDFETNCTMAERLPAILFMLSALAVVYLSGIAVGHYKVFPFQVLRDAQVTMKAIVEDLSAGETRRYHGEFMEFTEVGVDDLDTERVRSRPDAPPGQEDFLIYGGLNQYLEICPQHGCVAVRVSPDGRVVHGYPYLPGKVYAANRADGYPYEYIEFDPFEDTRPIGVQRFPDGDLLVTFQITISANVFPHGTGVARIDRDGNPRWFRFDYSHHWPTRIRGDDVLVPGLRVGDEAVSWVWPSGRRHVLGCRTNRPYRDTVRFLDGDGTLTREIDMLEAVLGSPYFAVLQQSTDGCDPVHLNFIDAVRDDLPAGIPGVAPGDLVVSLRNISAFGIIDAESGTLKRLVRGTFIQQHSVQHLSGGKFLMFDNHGGGPEGGTSRVLEIDLATGTERTVFPTKAFLASHPKVFSREAGHLSISPDRRRVLVNFSYQGTAFELRISDGKVLREIRSIHDVSRIGAFPEERHRRAAIFRFYGVDYVPR